MRRLAVLVSLSLACAGTSQAPPVTSPACLAADCPACPDRECPAVPEIACPACPSCPACPPFYPDTQTWHCIDDPPPSGKEQSYSYCWSTLKHCAIAHEIYVKERSTVKPCRPHTPVYCFHKHSDLSRNRIYFCAAAMEHCEKMLENEQERTKPEHDYTFSSCTRHP